MVNQGMEQNTTIEISTTTSKKAYDVLIQRKIAELLASLRLCR